MGDKKAIRLDETVMTVGYDNLIHSAYPGAEVFMVEVKKDQGVLKRGSLLVPGESGMELVSTTNNSEGSKVNAILAEDVDTANRGEKVPAIAYRTGHFNANALIMGEGYYLKAEDKEALRSVGILLSDAIDLTEKEAE